jgi:hypothetical protein
MPEVGSPATGKTLGDSAEVHKFCDQLEGEIAELKASYEQYFLGVERKPPNLKHDALKKRMNVLRNTFVRQTAAKFRVQQMAQKVATYERYWARTLKEMEEGTYKRDIFKARLHKGELKAAKKPDAKATESEDVSLDDFDVDEDAPPSTPPDAEAARGVQPGVKPLPPQAGAKPGTGPSVPAPGKPGARPSGVGPAVPAPGGGVSGPGVRVPVTGPMAAKQTGPVRAPVAAQGDLSDQKVKAIYDAYVTAKKRCNEDVSKLSLDSLASTLRKQVPDLMKQHKAKSVEFKVVIKDGKAILRALPK